MKLILYILIYTLYTYNFKQLKQRQAGEIQRQSRKKPPYLYCKMAADSSHPENKTVQDHGSVAAVHYISPFFVLSCLDKITSKQISQLS